MSDVSDEPAGGAPVEQIEGSYADEWVLLRVTAFDANHAPSHGEVIVHGGEKKVRKALGAILSTDGRPEARYYVFLAGHRIRSGGALREVVARAGAEEESGARWQG